MVLQEAGGSLRSKIFLRIFYQIFYCKYIQAELLNELFVGTQSTQYKQISRSEIFFGVEIFLIDSPLLSWLCVWAGSGPEDCLYIWQDLRTDVQTGSPGSPGSQLQQFSTRFQPSDSHLSRSV